MDEKKVISNFRDKILSEEWKDTLYLEYCMPLAVSFHKIYLLLKSYAEIYI